MTKTKKLLLLALAGCLLIAALWCYWEWPMAMDSRIPEENWVRVELRSGGVSGTYREAEFQNPKLDRILPQMGAVRLTRAEKRNYLDDEYFQILLFKGEAYPTMIYVGCAGNVQIAEGLDFDNWKNYEGGEDFYRYLKSYSQTLPAVLEMPAA